MVAQENLQMVAQENLQMVAQENLQMVAQENLQMVVQDSKVFTQYMGQYVGDTDINHDTCFQKHR